LKRKKPKRVADLVAIATIHAESDRMKDESDEEQRSKKSKFQPSNNNPPKNNKRKSDDGGSELVANANKGDRKNQRRKGGKSEYMQEVAEGQPCKLHSTVTKKATHLLRDCFMWKNRPGAAKGKDKEDIGDDSFDEDKAVLHIFTKTEKSEEKSILRAVNAIVPAVPQWLP
jgi:hypothetical protein